jgi:hypothetical protein
LAKRSGRGSMREFEPGLAAVERSNPALEPFAILERHIRTDFSHLPPNLQEPIVELLEQASTALDAALDNRTRREDNGDM